MSRRKPAPLDDLDALVAEVIVDAYGDDEPQVAFLEVFNQEAQLPAAATVLGVPIEVVGFDYVDGRQGIVAECRRDDSHQAVAVVDLTFPPDSAAAWVQAAYRRWLGPQATSVRDASAVAAVLVVIGRRVTAAFRPLWRDE